VTETLGRDLARALGSDDVERLRDRYDPGASFEAHLPGGSIVAEGRDGALAALGGRAGVPGRVRIVAQRASRGGLVLRLEATGDRIALRRRHLLHLRRGRVVHHVVYPERARVTELPRLPEDPLVRRIRSRRALDPGISGSTGERWRLRDGRVLFAKHLRPGGSWLTRATGARGREAELFVSGHLAQVAEALDHAVVAAIPGPDGWLLVTEDRTEALARPPATPAARRRFLAAVAAVHGRFSGQAVPAAGCLADRLLAFSPRTAARELAGSDLAPKVIGRGWELFADVAPPEVAEGVSVLLGGPEPLLAALERLPATFLHGDLRPANVGLGPGRPVVLDWGLAVVGPPAFEAAWWAFNSGWRSPQGLDRRFTEAVAALRRAVPGPPWPRRAIPLGLLATLVQVGCWFGFEAVQAPDPAGRRRAREGLAWWAERVRPALDDL